MGKDLLKLSDEEIRHVRGKDIAMVFQEPMTSLNPVLTIGRQLTETLETHLGMSREAGNARALELMGLVGISDPQRRLSQYPHHLSGGMRSEEHTSELQSLMRISYAVFCLKKKNKKNDNIMSKILNKL